MWNRIVSLAGLFALMTVGTVLAQSLFSSLPGGASSLRETYQDWQVACVMRTNTKTCGLSQMQTQQNGQRVLAHRLPATPRRP